MEQVANRTEYRILQRYSHKVVGELSEDKYTTKHWDDLVRNFYPLEDYAIVAHGIDDEEEPWEDEELPLHEFLINIGYIQLR